MIEPESTRRADFAWRIFAVVVWLVLSVVFVGAAYFTVIDEEFDWYFKVGPVMGAVIVVLGGLGGIAYGLRSDAGRD